MKVSEGETIDIRVDVDSGPNTLDAALWWPEYAFQLGFATIDPHNDIDLLLLDSSGSVRDYSVSIPSVFERARVESPAKGPWTLRIHGYKLASSEQTVYWAMAAHRR